MRGASDDGPESGPESGMVLVELLAALSILAIMSALMAGMLGQMRTIGRMGAEVTARAELAAAADHLARTIAAARPVALSGTEARRPPVLVGTSEGLRFVAVTRRGFDTLGLSEVTIAPRGASGDLVLIETLRPAHPRGAQVAEAAIVVEGLAAAEFAYVDADGTILPGWSAETLPAGVRITLTRSRLGRLIQARDFAATD